MQSLDLTAGIRGAAPLWLLPDGSLSATPDKAPQGFDARDALVTAARWVSGRRTSTFETLFPPSPFHPERPARKERLSAAQAGAMIEQIRGALAAAAVGGEAAKRDAAPAAQIRSAAVTVLSHIVATVLRDKDFRAVSDAAAAEIFRVIDAEQGDPTARGALRAHAILLLQLRGPALRDADKARAVTLLRGLVRAAPPYEEIKGPWRFAMCSDYEFHEGECEVLVKTHRFKPIDVPADAPTVRGRWGAMSYKAFEAPFKTPSGDPIQILARAANPTDENLEMAEPFFQGLLINRHAQLGSFDLRASTVKVEQRGYKLMMNSQCAGLTTRFAISRMFPDADIYSSWDSTYFRTDQGGGSGKVVASEGLDCFVAVLEGMSKGEAHADLEKRIREAQWGHSQASALPDFVQFVGPANPLVVSRFSDVNQDGRADYYDGFLDFYLSEIAEDLQASTTPRDPGVSASQVGGEAAKGLQWAAGSMDRVTQYSDLWAGLPGNAELFYAFQANGFFSHLEPPADLPPGQLEEDPSRLPAVSRYTKIADGAQRLQIEVMYHAWLAHSGKELKRLLVAADAMWRAFDLGHLPSEKELATPLGKRCMLLLTLAGLLEFPADQNFIDGLWSMALKALRLPDISRTAVRACITEADHNADNYYGSKRGLRQLMGDLEKSAPLAFQQLKEGGIEVGRAAPLDLTG